MVLMKFLKSHFDSCPHSLVPILHLSTVRQTTQFLNIDYNNGHYSVADPGFPVGGGVDFVGGPWTRRRLRFVKFVYVKTKELGPLGGRAPGAPPGSANAIKGNNYVYCLPTE